tara:strand:+ start:1207 stop:1569 length:363 start_codon:yes stop_codon:yes gene_type:complete
MKRWTFLEHKIYNKNEIEIHYDFLLENKYDCCTWKLLQIPKVDGSPAEIFPHQNHRLVWLTTKCKNLSRNRGTVNQIACGTYSLIENTIEDSNFSIRLHGKLFEGIFKKKNDICQICSAI